MEVSVVNASAACRLEEPNCHPSHTKCHPKPRPHPAACLIMSHDIHNTGHPCLTTIMMHLLEESYSSNAAQGRGDLCTCMLINDLMQKIKETLHAPKQQAASESSCLQLSHWATLTKTANTHECVEVPQQGHHEMRSCTACGQGNHSVTAHPAHESRSKHHRRPRKAPHAVSELTASFWALLLLLYSVATSMVTYCAAQWHTTCQIMQRQHN